MAKEPEKKIPITSYGIILFYIDGCGRVEYLASQRRDTIEYTDFLRGRYNQDDLELYFSLMTPEERDRLSRYSFYDLWDDLWVNHHSNVYRDSKPKAKAKFELVNVVNLLKNTETMVAEPGWGFPKGKRNYHETDIECAYREFKEETRIPLNYSNLLNIAPLTETFKGSNGKMYRTIYYIARADKKLPIHKITHKGIRTESVSEEVSELVWGDVNTLLAKLSGWRGRLLMDADSKIKRYLESDLL